MRQTSLKGGTCLKGKISDIYIHCEADYGKSGTWSAWSEEPTCRENRDIFVQKSRFCEGGFCEGPWLSVSKLLLLLQWLSPDRYALRHFRKLSTKRTTKLEKSLDR